jgi:hypothetical protein
MTLCRYVHEGEREREREGEGVGNEGEGVISSKPKVGSDNEVRK